MIHEPVLLNESKDFLLTDKNGKYFDGTAGFGGHIEGFLNELSGYATLIGTDKDISAFNFSTEKFAGDKRVTIYNTTFTDIDKIAKLEFFENFDGIFADLGVSSFQLDSAEEGFSFRSNSPFDLRMNKTSGEPAYEVANKFSAEEIADIIYKYGEEKKSRQIASALVAARKNSAIKESAQVKDIISRIVPEKYLNKTLSRVFQAFRIYVNNELGELEEFLDKSFDLLKPGGRIVILTYHSLEDRIVKEKLKYETLDCICPPELPVCRCDKVQRMKIVTRKPVVPSADEIKRNRRARSAKLRAGEKI